MDARCFPLAPASAPVTRSQVTNPPHLRRGRGGHGGGEGEAQPPGGGSVCSEASFTTPAGSAAHAAPAGAPFPHGLGPANPGRSIPTRPRSAHLSARPGPRHQPTVCRPSVRDRPGPPRPRSSYRCPRAPPARSGLTVRWRRRLRGRTVRRRWRRSGPTAAALLYRAGEGEGPASRRLATPGLPAANA